MPAVQVCGARVCTICYSQAESQCLAVTKEVNRLHNDTSVCHWVALLAYTVTARHSHTAELSAKRGMPAVQVCVVSVCIR